MIEDSSCLGSASFGQNKTLSSESNMEAKNSLRYLGKICELVSETFYSSSNSPLCFVFFLSQFLSFVGLAEF